MQVRFSEMDNDGALTLRERTELLNAEGIATATGSRGVGSVPASTPARLDRDACEVQWWVV